MQSNKLESARYIEKVLRESKSTSKGDQLESLHSQRLHNHSESIPVLVSATLLNSYNCGQIDVAVYKKKTLIVFEIKNTPELISYTQLRRLKHSVDFLSKLLSLEGKLVIIK